MLNKHQIKLWLLLLMSIFLLLSCGTRKRVMEQSTIKVNSLEQKDIVAIKLHDITTDLHIIRTDEKITYTAIDDSKPFYVEGKKYQNVVVEKKFTKEVDSSKTKNKTKQTKTDKTIHKTKVAREQKSVAVERDNSFSFWDWLWLLLAIVCVFFLVFRWKNIYSFIINLFKKIVL